MLLRMLAAGLLFACVTAPAMAQTQRTLTLQNSCSFPVYPGATTGAVAGSSCTTASNCATNQTCNNGVCYWPPLNAGTGSPLDAYTLEIASGGSATVTIAIPSTGANDIVWSGGIWAGTDAPGTAQRTTATVISGYCAQSQNFQWQVVPCSNQAVGPQNAPITQAEFTLQNSGDFYDITAINGVNVPLQMAPTVTATKLPGAAPPTSNSKYYNCAAAGSPTDALNPAQACTWTFAAKNRGVGMALVQHQSSPTLCSPTTSCATGQVCGIGYDSSMGTKGIFQECGTSIYGSWTAVQICAAAGYDDNNLINVSSKLKKTLQCGGSNTPLLQCTGTNSGSCYTGGASTSCCGCPVWPKDYKPSGGDQAVKDRCYNTNPSWTSVAFPFLPYVKTACPTMYSYQYDDVTSTFKCSSVPSGQSGINATNYTITYCPGGNTARIATGAGR